MPSSCAKGHDTCIDSNFEKQPSESESEIACESLNLNEAGVDEHVDGVLAQRKRELNVWRLLPILVTIAYQLFQDTHGSGLDALLFISCRHFHHQSNC